MSSIASSSETSASSTSRQDWLLAGLALVREAGESALTVEALCQRMERTKGSFYHHFAGRRGFIEALLEHWEKEYTGQIIQDLSHLDDPVHRLRALDERTVRDVDLRLERRIRVWADREPVVEAVLQRVDRARESYLYEQFAAALGDSHRARLAARAHMAMLVGTEMLYQDLNRAEIRELSAFVDHLGFIPEPHARDIQEDS